VIDHSRTVAAADDNVPAPPAPAEGKLRGLTDPTEGEDTGRATDRELGALVTEQHRGVGIPAGELDDDDLERELTHSHEKRHDIFVGGTADQLANHSSRTHELEAEYLRRFADRVKDAEAKAERY
jgi:hypothetical protein